MFLPNFPNPLFKNFDRYLYISPSLIPKAVSSGRWRWVKLRAAFFFGLKRGNPRSWWSPDFDLRRLTNALDFTELAGWYFRTFSNREGLVHGPWKIIARGWGKRSGTLLQMEYFCSTPSFLAQFRNGFLHNKCSVNASERTVLGTIFFPWKKK